MVVTLERAGVTSIGNTRNRVDSHRDVSLADEEGERDRG